MIRHFSSVGRSRNDNGDSEDDMVHLVVVQEQAGNADGTMH